MLLLHTTGAKSGKERVNPMMYRDVGDELAVFASKAGARPIRTGTTTFSPIPRRRRRSGRTRCRSLAREAKGDERTKIWEAQKKDYPGFASTRRARRARSRS